MAQKSKAVDTSAATAKTKLVYAGPTLIRYGLAKGNVYVGGIPANAPEVLHFAFVPIADLSSVKNDADFISKCTAAIKSLRGTK